MNLRIFSFTFALIALAFGSHAAKADWYEASSEHFVIYADDSEKDIRRFAENLERYQSALANLTGRKLENPSPSNRVTIFVAGSGRDIRRLVGEKNSNIAGFYIPRAGGSKAFVQNIRHKNGYPHFSTVVLLHEYAHHFLISTNRHAMPRWLSEGAAEFFAATTFNKDGSILIGRPAQHRAYELSDRTPVTAWELLDPELSAEAGRSANSGFYGRSWLLYHYLTFSEERPGQLNAYWQQVASGVPSLEAGEAVFGDLRELDRDLKAYLRERRMYTFNLGPDRLQIGEVTLRKLPEGEAEMMPLRMVSQRGVTREQAEELLPEIREVAAQYPGDAGVLSALAEAEYDAGNDDAAIAAADRAIAIDPARANPYVQKGYALFRKASDADASEADAAYEAAMKPFGDLNKRENDHPLPLIYFYRSFAERGMSPPENARAALKHAARLAPFDQGLWVQVAMMQAREGKIELAKASLQPLAADPHGSGPANLAKAMITALDNGTEGEPFRLRTGSAAIMSIDLDDDDADADDDGEGGAGGE
ncbi:DUF1570 domain-containing protein [Erythrobacter sp. MTPC3]|uniref:DUF1570 domain-containing protein n=1 Tax=Erythrobacter sp. MTPC3 TaxID=3056564 RepID=UPI0036F356D2